MHATTALTLATITAAALAAAAHSASRTHDGHQAQHIAAQVERTLDTARRLERRFVRAADELKAQREQGQGAEGGACIEAPPKPAPLDVSR